MIPHTRPPVWPEVPSHRFAAKIQQNHPEECQIALLGMPDHLGVQMNNGRPGAAEGPTAFRAALAKYGGDFDAHLQQPMSVKIYDAGDLIPAPSVNAEALHETHDRLTEAVAAIHAQGLFPICVGGGHDLTYPSIRALAQHCGQSVGGINIDAHLDVRETIGSGMPFRRAIDETWLDPSRFCVWGIDRFANSQAHLAWLSAQQAQCSDVLAIQRGHIQFQEALDHAAPTTEETAFLSVDLDAIDASQAPGVSALNPMGLSVNEVVLAVQQASRHKSIKHFDIMELSPPYDQQGRTARVAALLFLSFVAGWQQRI